MNQMSEEDLGSLREMLSGLPPQPAVEPDPALRAQLLDLAEMPSLPVDPARYRWFEPVPGIRIAIVKEDAQRGLRACLAIGKAGARHPRHRHGGDELIYVLEGVLRDERGSYGPGALCRSRTGDVHSEEVVEDCLCYIVYYGELEMLEGPAAP